MEVLAFIETKDIQENIISNGSRRRQNRNKYWNWTEDAWQDD